MPIHDYSCTKCGAIIEDVTSIPVSCQGCEGTSFTVTYRNWRTMHALEGGTARDSLHDSKGAYKKFNATSDPLCQIELGLGEDKGIRSFNADQSVHFMEKMLTDGDSPRLRDEMLRTRNENLKKPTE